MAKKLLIFIAGVLLATGAFFLLAKRPAQWASLAKAVRPPQAIPKEKAVSALQKASGTAARSSVPARNNYSRRIGEKIVYEVRLGKAYLGKAEFRHLADVSLEGKKVSLMIFETKLAQFTDTETIYSDPFSNLPVRIEREISTWPIPEKIIEEYDQKRFLLKIRKIKGNKEQQVLIRKSASIHNAILLPYYVRTIPSLKIGWVLMAQLPGEKFEIKLIAKEFIRIPAGRFRAYRFVSNPKKFEIWISADKRRIPLKIIGMGNLGYVMVMKAYTPHET